MSEWRISEEVIGHIKIAPSLNKVLGKKYHRKRALQRALHRWKEQYEKYQQQKED